MRIEPTIGRVVHFFPHVDSAPDPLPFAALLAGINDGGTINLAVFARDGSTYPVQGVKLLQGDEPAPVEGHYAAWMPFQKGQVPASSAMEQRVGQLEALLGEGGAVNELFGRLEDKFDSHFAGLEARINALPTAQPGDAGAPGQQS